MADPRVFVGSSSERLEVAHHFQAVLERAVACEVTVWDQDAFGLANHTMTSLVEAARAADFAVLLLTPDDMTASKGLQGTSPRDNVVFELGLFMGELGVQRVFMLSPDEDLVKLPSDLDGITHLPPYRTRSDDNLEAALTPAALRAAKAIRLHGRRSDHDRNWSGGAGRSMLDWGFMFESLVDATLCVASDHDARADIERHINEGWVIPTRYHYSTDVGAENWLQLSKNHNYRLGQNTVNYWTSDDGRAMADRIRNALGSAERLDLISLGTGDGEKDAVLIGEWLDAGLDIIYYPYDVSLRLAANAAHRVRKLGNEHSSSLHAKVVLADFEDIATMRRVFDYRDAPNVISFLGTLGNLSNDRQFLGRLRECMSDQDVLLLEVRLRADSASDSASETRMFGSDEISLKHDFGPLAHYFGLPFNADFIKTVTTHGLSRIDSSAATTVVTYVGPAPEGKQWPKDGVRLQYIHQYDPEIFLEEIAKMGFRVIYAFPSRSEGFLECLVARRPKV